MRKLHPDLQTAENQERATQLAALINEKREEALTLISNGGVDRANPNATTEGSKTIKETFQTLSIPDQVAFIAKLMVEGSSPQIALWARNTLLANFRSFDLMQKYNYLNQIKGNLDSIDDPTLKTAVTNELNILVNIYNAQNSSTSFSQNPQQSQYGGGVNPADELDQRMSQGSPADQLDSAMGDFKKKLDDLFG